MATTSSANIVGSSSPSTWSQAQYVSYANERKLWIVIKLDLEEGSSIAELSEIGGEMISAIEKLGQSCTESKQVKEIVEETCLDVAEGIKAELAIALVDQDRLALYGNGQMGAYLCRGGEVALLKNKWEDKEVLSGLLKPGDRVLLATQSFVEIVGLSTLKDTLIEDESPAEALAPLLHRQADSSGAAAILSSIEEEKRQVKWPIVNKGNSEPRKLNLWVGGIILGLLIIMIGIGMVRRVAVVAEKDYVTLTTSVEGKINELKSQSELNPELSRALLSQARNEINNYLATKIKDEYKVKAGKMLDELDLVEDQAFKKNEIKLTTLVELPVLSDGLSATKMKSDGKGNLIFLDTKEHKIVSMNITDRSRKIVGTGTDTFTDTATTETKIFGLNTEGVFEIGIKDESIKKMIEPDEFWKAPAQLAFFAGNAYIFDSEQSEIWKYPTLGDTFGGRRRWLAPSITPDLSKVIDMKVVGDIWLLTSSGKLERYSRGAPVKFSMLGFPSNGDIKLLSEPSSMWVSADAVYVVENGAGRIVVFDQEGKYLAQYMNEEFARASDIVVVDDKVYVLIGNVVKEFGL